MTVLTYSEARRNFAGIMKSVCDDRTPAIITRRNSETVVMLSMADYEALQETAHLMNSPKNARRLLESIEELSKGKGKERKLVA
jgi:antitoxin YefM